MYKYGVNLIYFEPEQLDSGTRVTQNLKDWGGPGDGVTDDDGVDGEGEWCWSQMVSVFSSLPNHVHFRSFVVHSTSVDSDHSLLR